MPEEIVQQLDYKNEILSTPMYKFKKISPSNSAAVVLTTTGGNDSTFDIPTNVHNLARSMLFFQINVYNDVGTALYNYSHNSALAAIQEIRFIGKNSGVSVCNITKLQDYTHVTFTTDIPEDHYANYDTFYHNSGVGRYLRPNIAASGFTTQGAFAKRATDASNPSIPLKEQSYVEIGNVAVAVVNTIGLTLNFAIPLSMIRNSIFSVDKDMFWNEPMQLTIIWGNRDRFVYAGTSATDPTAGAISVVRDIPVTNLNLFLAVEQNEAIANKIISHIKDPQSPGLTIPISYVTTVRTPVTSSTAHNITYTIGRGQGHRLLKIYHTFTNSTTETLNAAYDNRFLAGTYGAAGAYFYTQLEGGRLQDYNLNFNTYDDWANIQQKLVGSIIFNSAIYRNSWVWIDSFDDCKKTSDIQNNTEIKGIDTSTGLRYDFILNLSTATALTHYDFIVCQKMLTIGPNGIIIN